MNIPAALRRLTPQDHAAKREKVARQMADHHEIEAIKARDSVAWALAQAAHHDQMGRMYRERLA